MLSIHPCRFTKEGIQAKPYGGPCDNAPPYLWWRMFFTKMRKAQSHFFVPNTTAKSKELHIHRYKKRHGSPYRLHGMSTKIKIALLDSIQKTCSVFANWAPNQSSKEEYFYRRRDFFKDWFLPALIGIEYLFLYFLGW